MQAKHRKRPRHHQSRRCRGSAGARAYHTGRTGQVGACDAAGPVSHAEPLPRPAGLSTRGEGRRSKPRGNAIPAALFRVPLPGPAPCAGSLDSAAGFSTRCCRKAIERMRTRHPGSRLPCDRAQIVRGEAVYRDLVVAWFTSAMIGLIDAIGPVGPGWVVRTRPGWRYRADRFGRRQGI